MPLALDKLEHVRERAGRIVGRCPACAEGGADKSGEHLVILESGKFGCIAHPGPAGHEHRRRIAELAGENATATATPRPPPPPAPRPACRPTRPLPTLRKPTSATLAQIAAIRSWHTADGLEVLVERGQLFIADVYDDGRSWPAWLVGDSTRANVQARKLDGGVWTGIGGKKAKSLPGTSTLRMIGPADIGTRPTVWLCEGQPDFAAAPILAKLAGLDLDQVAFCCITGANENPAPLHPDDLSHFKGKRVVIAMHHDAAHGLGTKAATNWARQLSEAADVTGFNFAGTGGKDLADYLRALSQTAPSPAPTPAPPRPATATESPPSPPLTTPKATPPAPASRPLLVPLECPWVDGARYRRAQAVEWPSRLDLYHLEPTGDTMRKHGTLIPVQS